MKLIQEEEVLAELKSKSGRSTMILTSYRVHQKKSYPSGMNIDSIMLEQISLCSIQRTSSPIALILAVIAAVAGIGLAVAQSHERDSSSALALVAGLVMAGILMLFWYLSRTTNLVIRSSGGRIQYFAQGVKIEEVEQLLNRVEEAKVARVAMLAPIS